MKGRIIMTDDKQYVNKFHKFEFKTDSQKDMELNTPPISKDIDTLKINDDFSNKLEVDYKNSGEVEDINPEK